MFYRKPHPWDGRWAIPDYVYAEHPLRGTHTTKYRRRKSIDISQPGPKHPWHHGYALPQNVKDEDPGRGVYATGYMPRRTVDHLVPNYLGDDAGQTGVRPGSAQDPVTQFGRKMADFIVTSIKMVPAADRRGAMRALFDQIDPTLWRTVAERAEQLRQAGVGQHEALRRAIAASMSSGLVREMMELGRTRRGPKPKSMLGLAAYGVQQQHLGIFGIGDKLKSAGNWLVGAAGTVGNAACRVVSDPLGQAGVAAGTAAAGGDPRIGAAGAQIAAQACQRGKGGQQQQAPAAQPFPIVPLAVGAFGLAAVYLLTR